MTTNAQDFANDTARQTTTTTTALWITLVDSNVTGTYVRAAHARVVNDNRKVASFAVCAYS